MVSLLFAGAVAWAAEPDAGVPALSAVEAEQVLALECQACHSLGYVEQQRLSVPQWVATLTKMRTWGALIDEGKIEPLARSLAVRRGPTAPLPKPPRVEVKAFVAAEAPSRAPEVVERGRALFASRCAACHAPDGHGAIGVNLGDRPILQTPAAFADFVKVGRGRMPPNPDLTPAQLGDLRAWLGAQR